MRHRMRERFRLWARRLEKDAGARGGLYRSRKDAKIAVCAVHGMSGWERILLYMYLMRRARNWSPGGRNWCWGRAVSRTWAPLGHCWTKPRLSRSETSWPFLGDTERDQEPQERQDGPRARWCSCSCSPLFCARVPVPGRSCACVTVTWCNLVSLLLGYWPIGGSIARRAPSHVYYRIPISTCICVYIHYSIANPSENPLSPLMPPHPPIGVNFVNFAPQSTPHTPHIQQRGSRGGR